MNIFILEEDILQQQRLELLIKKITLEKDIPYKILFSSGKSQKILNKIDFPATHPIYFLNTYVQGNPHGGFLVAQKIRQKDLSASIVFVSVHRELAKETFTYKVTALDFIDTKLPLVLFEKKLTECLLVAHANSQKRNNLDTFYLQNNQTEFQIPFTDILYFETSDKPHKIRLIGKNQMIEFYATLQEILKQDPRLFQCHKSYVINLENIISINKATKGVTFYGKKNCLISRRKMTELLKKISKYKK